MTAVTGRHPPAASSPRASVPAPRPPFGVRASGGLQAGGAAIRIRLLGRFAVDLDGQEIALREFGGGLARRLLRLLALRRGTLVPKDLIADALWPDDPPADPAGNIEVLVSRIRRALGDRALIRTGPGGYVLPDGDRCWVDAEAFLDAVQAGRSALAARPDHVPLLYNLACTESRAGRLDEALQHLQQAVALEPDRAGNAQTEPDFDPIRALPGFPGR